MTNLEMSNLFIFVNLIYSFMLINLVFHVDCQITLESSSLVEEFRVSVETVLVSYTCNRLSIARLALSSSKAQLLAILCQACAY